MTKQESADELSIQLSELGYGELSTLCDTIGIDAGNCDTRTDLECLLLEYYINLNFIQRNLIGDNLNYPANHVYNPNFKYVPAERTNVRETFERIKRDAERTIEVIREYEVVTVPEAVCCTNNHPSNEEVRRMLGFGLIQHKGN